MLTQFLTEGRCRRLLSTAQAQFPWSPKTTEGKKKPKQSTTRVARQHMQMDFTEYITFGHTA